MRTNPLFLLTILLSAFGVSPQESIDQSDITKKLVAQLNSENTHAFPSISNLEEIGRVIDIEPSDLVPEAGPNLFQKPEKPSLKFKTIEPKTVAPVFSLEDEEEKGPSSISEDPGKNDEKVREIQLQERFKQLFYLLDDDQEIDFSKSPAGLALTTDKLVYKPGETILVQAYFYDKYDKSPRHVEQVDTPYKLILKSDSNFYAAIEEDFQRLGHVILFSIRIPETQTGGQYQVQLTNNFEEVIQTQPVFILGVDLPSEMLLMDVDKDEVLLRGKVKAEISLRVLGREVASDVLSGIEVEVQMHSFSKIFEKKVFFTDFTGKVFVEFEIDAERYDSEEEVSLTASLIFDKKRLTANRQIKITNLKKIQCEMTPVNKLFYKKPSKIYIQCFTTFKKQTEFVLKDAQIIEESRQGMVSNLVLDQISTDDSGLGMVEVTMKEDYNYFLLVKFGDFTKRIRMPRPSRRLGSQFVLSLNKTVLAQTDTLEVSVQTEYGQRNKKIFLIIQDKMKILTQRKVQMQGNKGDLSIELDKLDFANGGVLAVQLFTSTDEFNNILTEKLIYVHPKQKLTFQLKMNKDVFNPGDEAVFSFETVDPPKGDILWQVVVTDEAGFLQIDKKKHPPSLITKVFLENDLFFSKENIENLPLNKRLENSKRYVDWFFQNDDSKTNQDPGRSLEYLLLNQNERKGFLSPKGLFDFLINYSGPRPFNSETMRLRNYLLAGDSHQMSRKFQKMKKNFEEREKISFDRILTLYDSSQAVSRLSMNVNSNSFDSVDFGSQPSGIMLENETTSFSAMGDGGFGGAHRKSRSSNSPQGFSTKSLGNPQSGTDPTSVENMKSILSKDTLIFSALGTNLSSSEIKFKIPNHVGKFRVDIIGVSSSGVYGTLTSSVQLQKKFNARAFLPQFIRLEDQLEIPLTIENNTE